MKTFLASRLADLVRAATWRPLVTVVLTAILAAAAAFYAASTLRLEGDVTELVDADSQFLRNYGAYKAAYPQHRRLNVIVIDGADARRARLAEQTLMAGMSGQTELFPNVYAPGSDPFLQRNALLYLPTARLEGVVDSLAQAQPALAIMASDPSLRGLAKIFTEAGSSDAAKAELEPLARIIAETSQAVARGQGRAPSWAEILLSDAAPRRRLIIYQGSLEGDDGQVSRAQAAAVQAIVAENSLVPENGVTVRTTGRGPLSSAELESALSSIQFVGLCSLLLVAGLLWFSFRSFRAILAAVLTLVSGLVLTAAFAALAVGSLNVLSLTFAVLFIGLGIDFAIHVILRRMREGTGAAPAAWVDIARGLGPTILLCGLTTAVAFLAFLPTDFRGLAELGLISAVGMGIAVFGSFTILPALLDVLGSPAGSGSLSRAAAPATERWGGVLTRNARTISLGALVLLAVGAVVGSQVRFDFNSLNLQNTDNEAVRTLTDLHADGTITPYSLTVSAPDLAAAGRIADDLAGLREVGAVKTLLDYVPQDQDARLAVLDTARIILGPSIMLVRKPNPPDAAGRAEAAQVLAEVGGRMSGADRDVFARMEAGLRPLSGDGAALARLESLLAEDFVESLALLRTALSAEKVSVEQLPDELIARETGTGGEIRVVALPREDLRNFEALSDFVDAVHSLYPSAHGRPSLEAGVGDVVVAAFRQAFLTAAVAIFLVLVVALRSFTDAMLVMIPLLLAAALTAAVMTVAAIPLNVANVIVLPLLLGMGVDNSLHVVGRYRESGSIAGVFRSSTPRAVVTSVLTTLFSFAALAFAEHRGMASMGQLLAVAIGFILFATLIVLPGLLAWRVGTAGRG